MSIVTYNFKSDGFQNIYNAMEELLGTYRGTGTENMDAYFKAKGMVWPLRKMIMTMMNPNNAVRKFIRNDDGTYEYKDVGSTRNPVKWTFELGKEFSAISYDGKEHKIKFDFDGSKKRLFEKHTLADDPTNDQVYEHYLDQGKLIWILRIRDTEAKWFYDKEQ